MNVDNPTLEWLVVSSDFGCAYIEGELECLLTRRKDPPGLEWEVIIPYDARVGGNDIKPLLPLTSDGSDGMNMIALPTDGGILHGVVSSEDHNDSEVRIKAVNFPPELSDEPV